MQKKRLLQGALFAAVAAMASPASYAADVTVRFATIFDANEMARWEPIVAEYQSLNPGVEIKVETTAGSGAAVYPDVLRTSMASGDPPDLFFMWGGEIAGPFIDAGQVKDIGAYFEKYGWDKVVAPWTIERIKRNGKLYGVPYRARGMGFWYRKDIFDKFGLTPPKTYAELEKICETLKSNDIHCASTGGKFGWHTMRILDYFIEKTCGIEKHNQLNRLEASWADPCVVEAYGLMKKWVDNGWLMPDFLTVSPDDARMPVYQGAAAMDLEGDWWEGVYQADGQPGENFAFFLPPTDHEPVRFSAFPEQWMIPAGAKHPDEAAAFINWIIQPDTQKKYPEAFVASATAGVSPDCTKMPKSCEWKKIIETSTDTYPPTDQAFTKELIDGFFEVQDGIIAGKYTPEDGAAEMQKRAEAWKKAKGG